MRRGFFIALEGVDGSGKSTHARLLARALEDQGYEVVLTREPSDGSTGAKLRQYLLGPDRYLSPQEELELFTADRREHLAQVIGPALEQGLVVISDRYYYSSAAYQGALGLDPARIMSEQEKFAPRPDLAVFLDLAPDAALARRRGRPRQVSESRGYLEQVAAIYQTFQGPEAHHVDAAGSLEEVQEKVLAIALQALKRQGRASVRRRAP